MIGVINLRLDRLQRCKAIPDTTSQPEDRMKERSQRSQRMRMRSIFAVLIAILLLVVSSWATTCDLSCSMQMQHLVCATTHAGALPSPSMSQHAMMHHGHGHPSVDMGVHSKAQLIPSAGVCVHASCAHHTVATSFPAGNAIDHAQLQPVLLLNSGLIAPPIQLLPAELLAERMPSPSRALFDPLAVSLRI
jgi:hypothetical protein